MNDMSLPIAEPIMQLQRQLAQFRSAHARRSKLPKALWQAAVEPAREHGIYAVAHPLRLDYLGLKRRLGGDHGGKQPARRRLTKPASKPAFVELVPPHRSLLEECMIEIESARGGKMRIQWKAFVPPNWASLLRAWREAEGRFRSRHRCVCWWPSSRSMAGKGLILSRGFARTNLPRTHFPAACSCSGAAVELRSDS